jgi:hypothetical protein
MNGGVAVAKTHSYPNNKYDFPVWLRGRKNIKTSFDVKELIVNKLSKVHHLSNNKTIEYVLPFFANMFKNNTMFAIKMKNKLDLSENEIEFLLGKTHAHKLKEILYGSETEVLPTVEKEEINEEDIEKNENIQQSLFDF